MQPFPSTARKYETVIHPERLAALLDAARDQGHVAFRAKVTSADPMQGELVGVALALRARARGLRSARPPRRRRARSRRRQQAARIQMREALDLLKPLLEDPSRAQDRAERQVRHGGARPLRHRARRLRRSLPHVLRARRRPRRASARSSLPARSSATPASPTRRSWAPAAPPSPSTSVPLGARHGICRRGGRHRLAALARAEAAACRRARHHRLRDAGAADRAGAGADGADRHQGRARDARAAFGQLRPEPRAGSKTRSASLPARTSTSARRSSSARSCSTR